MNGTVTITKSEYYCLQKDSWKLNYLERGGVDNWEGYMNSLRPNGEISFKEQASIIKEEIEKM